jgi:hypothetical protein
VAEIGYIVRVEYIEMAREKASAQQLDAISALRASVDQSSDADSEYHRLMLRRCRRAETAALILEEVAQTARDDLDITEEQLAIVEDPIAEPLMLEIATAKAQVVSQLKRLLPLAGK